MPEAISSNVTPQKRDDSFIQPKFYGKIMGKKVEDILAELKAGVEIPARKTQESIQKIDDKAAALSSFQNSVQGLNTSLKALGGKGIGGAPSGAFASRSISLVSGSLDNIDASATSDAPLGDIQVLIKQLATKDDRAASAGVADPNAALGWTGSFVVGAGNTTTTINVTNTMSMNDLLDAVNNHTSTIGVNATLTTFPSAKVLSFQATNFAAPIAVDTTNLVVPINATYDASILPTTSSKTVQDLSAKVQFRNINTDIYYPSNEIPAGSQVNGVTIKLLKADPVTPNVITVQNNVNAATEAINTFVASYNSFQDYLATPDAYKGDVRNTVRMAMETLFGNVSGVASDQLLNLAVLGIMPGEDGKLSIDQGVFTTHMNTKFSQVANVFGYNISTTSSAFIAASRPKVTNADMLTTGVQVTVNKAMDGSLSATMTLGGHTYPATLGTIDGSTVTINGPVGTADNPHPLEGLSIVFNGLLNLPNGAASSVSSNVTFTSGIADRLSTTLTGFLDPDPKNGLFSRSLQEMVGDKTDKNIKGEKQRLEDKKLRQEEAAQAKLKKFELQFERAQQIAAKAEALKHTIEVFTKMAAAA